MTQKELLYLEDAIKHEDNVIKIIDFSLENLTDDNLIDFMDKERKVHEKLKDNLLNILEDKVNE